MNDSVCALCRRLKVTTENPDAENGPGTESYIECDGYPENIGTPGGCCEWERGNE